MNTQVPIGDVILVLAVVGLALSPWPWLALLGAALFFIAVAFVNDRREAPPPPPEEHPQ
jgi:hypothetical protein